MGDRVAASTRPTECLHTMAQFVCQTCNSSFEVPQAALEKFPGWEPKYCRSHSRGASGGARASSRGSARRPHPGASREENLTLAEVLERYSDGPTEGIFTDGSAVPNPGRGGWGMVWVEDGGVRAQEHGEEASTTNNRMELTALIMGFRALPADARVTLHTDSRLCVDTINTWAPNWERKGWKKKGGPIKNLELVKELLTLRRAHPQCKLEWIAAHSGNRWNEYADSLASAWRRAEL